MQLVKILKHHKGFITKVKFSKNGKFLASSSKDKTINIYNVENNFEFLRKLYLNESTVYSIDFSLDEKYFASSNQQGFVFIYDILNNFEVIKDFKGFKDLKDFKDFVLFLVNNFS